MKLIDTQQAAHRLKAAHALRVLAHSHPDGDTLGCAFALAWAAHRLGKDVCVLCEDPTPPMFAFMSEGLPQREREDGLLVCVDVADEHLLGERLGKRFGGQIALSIDHHAANRLFAAETCAYPTAAATAEIVSDIIDLLGVLMDQTIAACLYAGISTDTGCFRYSNTTARSHRYAARYMDLGVPTETLDRAFFETKTKTYAALERMAFEGLRFYCDERVAMIVVTQEMFRKSGSNEDEFIQLVPQTRQIEGVLVGVSFREREDGTFKISLRSHAPVDASEICAKMGGGGHARAAGCASGKPLEEAVAEVIGHITTALPTEK